jgi:hypothetical protein
LIAVGALTFVGGLGVTAIEGIVWFETGRVPTWWRRVLGMELPLDLMAIVTGAVIGVTGALVVHR